MFENLLPDCVYILDAQSVLSANDAWFDSGGVSVDQVLVEFDVDLAVREVIFVIDIWWNVFIDLWVNQHRSLVCPTSCNIWLGISTTSCADIPSLNSSELLILACYKHRWTSSWTTPPLGNNSMTGWTRQGDRWPNYQLLAHNSNETQLCDGHKEQPHCMTIADGLNPPTTSFSYRRF